MRARMDQQKRHVVILIGLLALWGLIFAFRSPWGSPARLQPRAGATTAPRGPAPVPVPVAQGGGLPRLKQELLHLPPPVYPPEAQNVFGTPSPTGSPPRPAQAAVTTPTPQPPPPPDPFQEEAKRLRYVGFLQAADKTMAFIVRGGDVYTVEVGATIAERFRVQAVTEDSVMLSSTAGDKQVRLPLVAETGPAPKR